MSASGIDYQGGGQTRSRNRKRNDRRQPKGGGRSGKGNMSGGGAGRHRGKRGGRRHYHKDKQQQSGVNYRTNNTGHRGGGDISGNSNEGVSMDRSKFPDGEMLPADFWNMLSSSSVSLGVQQPSSHNNVHHNQSGFPSVALSTTQPPHSIHPSDASSSSSVAMDANRLLEQLQIGASPPVQLMSESDPVFAAESRTPPRVATPGPHPLGHFHLPPSSVSNGGSSHQQRAGEQHTADSSVDPTQNERRVQHQREQGPHSSSQQQQQDASGGYVNLDDFFGPSPFLPRRSPTASGLRASLELQRGSQTQASSLFSANGPRPGQYVAPVANVLPVSLHSPDLAWSTPTPHSTPLSKLELQPSHPTSALSKAPPPWPDALISATAASTSHVTHKSKDLKSAHFDPYEIIPSVSSADPKAQGRNLKGNKKGPKERRSRAPPPSAMTRLQTVLESHVKAKKPSSSIFTQRNDLCVRVEGLLRTIWPQAQVQAYGSSVTGLCHARSDMDLSLLIPESVIDEENAREESPSETSPPSNKMNATATTDSGVTAVPANSNVDEENGDAAATATGGGVNDNENGDEDKKQRKKREPRPPHRHARIIQRLGAVLEEAQFCNVKALPRARVPVVKFTDPNLGIEIDICVNNYLAIANSRLIRDYCQIDDRLPSLVFLIKHWAKLRKVNDPYRGTLSSYAYVLMCLNYLQLREPPILPCLQRDDIPEKLIGDFNVAYDDDISRYHKFGEANRESLAQLIVGFMQLWAHDFDYRGSVVSVRCGTLITKKSKNWTETKGRDRHWVSIEDPFEVTHDLGRVCDRTALHEVRGEFMRAHRILCEDGDFDAVCDPYTEEWRGDNS